MKNSINFAKLFVLAMLMMFVVACAKKPAAAAPVEGEVTSEAVAPASSAPAEEVVVEEITVVETPASAAAAQ